MKKLLVSFILLLLFAPYCFGAEQTINGIFAFPSEIQNDDNRGYTPIVVLLDAEGEKVAMIFQAPKTGNIDKLCFLTGTVTTGDDVDVRLETVDTSTGMPSGTLKDTNTNATETIADANDNVWFETAITADAAVVKGDWLAIVIVNGAAGNMSISSKRDVSVGYSHKPYTAEYLAAAWAKTVYAPVMGIIYDDAAYANVPGAYPYSGGGATSYMSTDNPNEYGVKFQLPFPCRITGAWLYHEPDSNATVRLYNAASSVLTDITLDKDITANTSVGGPHWVIFDNTVSISKDVWYRLTVEADDAVDLEQPYGDVGSAAAMGGLPGGTNWYGTGTNDGSSWTDTTTRRYWIGILIDGFDDGVSAGGGGYGAGWINQ